MSAMDPFGGVPVTPQNPSETTPPATGGLSVTVPGTPASTPATPPAAGGLSVTVPGDSPTASTGTPVIPSSPAGSTGMPAGLAVTVPSGDQPATPPAASAPGGSSAPGGLALTVPSGDSDPQPATPQPAAQTAAQPDKSKDEPGDGVWRIGNPVTADPNEIANPAPYVESRKPVTLPDGREVSDVPGEPVYTMPGDIREYQPARDRYGRYMHQHPQYGYRSSFSRATTIAKKLDSGSNLMDWHDRKLIEGLARYPQLLDGLDVGKLGTTNEYKLRQTLKQISENATNAAGAADGREFGTALHAWTEAVDHGKASYADVPCEFKPYVASYLQALSRHGIKPIPEYVERIMYCPITDTMGTIDRIYRLPTGELVIGDIKTSGNIDFAWTSIALQMAQYANASHLLSEDGQTWEPMPKVRHDIAVIAGIPHTPKDRGPHCDMHIVNVEYGTGLLYIARDITHVQREAKKIIPMSHSAQPGSADDAMAWVEQGMPALSQPGANPLSQLEGMADTTAQAAMNAMDGDTSKFESLPVVGDIVDGTNQSEDSKRVHYLSDVASVLSRAVEMGLDREIVQWAGVLATVPDDQRSQLVQGLSVASARAGVRSSRLRTRASTDEDAARREDKRAAKAQSVAAQRETVDKATSTGALEQFGKAVTAAQTTDSAPKAPALFSTSAGIAATADQTGPSDPVNGDAPVAGVRPSVRARIESQTTPQAIAALYDASWSTQEEALARERMSDLSAALIDSARSLIDAAGSADAIAALWEPWWPDDLVSYAQSRMARM